MNQSVFQISISTSHRLVTAVLMGLLLFTLAFAQKSEKSPSSKPASGVAPTPATLTGRAFLITQSGDVKPARMARMFIVSGDKQQEVLRAVKQALDNMESDRFKGREGIAISCMDNSTTIINSLPKAPQSSDFPGGIAFLTQTDEDGYFGFDNLKAGGYTLVADGRAGMYLGVWIKTVTLEPGKNTIKLASPTFPCETAGMMN